MVIIIRTYIEFNKKWFRSFNKAEELSKIMFLGKHVLRDTSVPVNRA